MLLRVVVVVREVGAGFEPARTENAPVQGSIDKAGLHMESAEV